MTLDIITFADTLNAHPRARHNAGRFSWRGNMLEGLLMWCLTSFGLGALYAGLNWHDDDAVKQARRDHAEYLRSVVPAKFLETTHNGCNAA